MQSLLRKGSAFMGTFIKDSSSSSDLKIPTVVIRGEEGKKIKDRMSSQGITTVTIILTPGSH